MLIKIPIKRWFYHFMLILSVTMLSVIIIILIRKLYSFILKDNCNAPMVISTWEFTNATTKSWSVLNKSGTAIDAVVAGCTVCEQEECDGTVGYGGSPDENGETSLDALIIDGATMNMGAVGNMKRIKSASKVARLVMENTKHTLLVGDEATQFAIQMGFKETNLSTIESLDLWKQWKSNNCQPNFWTNVNPDPKNYCGPYKPNLLKNSRLETNFVDTKNLDDNEIIGNFLKTLELETNFVDTKNHDTIGVIAIDHEGNIAAGTSTNGAKFKIPGIVGDSPIPGSGAYAMNTVGAAVATGDGDILMRFLPSFHAVQAMKNGYNSTKAAQLAIDTIANYYPDFSGAVIAVNKYGDYGAACHGFDRFPYSIANLKHDKVSILYITCI